MDANETKRVGHQTADESGAVNGDRLSKPVRPFADADNKRSLFTPVILVLLVMSLIGNVLLYAQYLQNGTRQQVVEGWRIIESGLAARNDLAAVQAGLDDLAQASSIKDRMFAKQNLARLTANVTAQLTGLLSLADGRDGRDPLGQRKDKATAFIIGAGEALMTIGSHAGPLTEEERASIAMLRQSYAALAELAESLNFEANPNDSVARYTAASGKWVDVAYKLADTMIAGQLPAY